MWESFSVGILIMSVCRTLCFFSLLFQSSLPGSFLGLRFESVHIHLNKTVAVPTSSSPTAQLQGFHMIIMIGQRATELKSPPQLSGLLRWRSSSYAPLPFLSGAEPQPSPSYRPANPTCTFWFFEDRVELGLTRKLWGWIGQRRTLFTQRTKFERRSDLSDC